MKTFFGKSLWIIAVMLIPALGFAQANMPKALQRIQIGYSFPMTNAQYTQRYKVFDATGMTDVDTTFHKDFRPKGAFGITVGTYIPVVKIGENSCLSISVDFVYNSIGWDAKMVIPNGFDQVKQTYTYNTSFAVKGVKTTHMALPIGLDFKTGGEASLDRNRKVSLTLGGGIYPSRSSTTFDANSKGKFKVQPFVKAELGVFAGINVKVRALYAIGKTNYVDFKQGLQTDAAGFEQSISMSSRSSLTLSLILQPFSFKWDKTSWWN